MTTENSQDGVLQQVLDWLRAGYPEGVPPKDYFPLLALLTKQLSETEVDAVIGGGRPVVLPRAVVARSWQRVLRAGARLRGLDLGFTVPSRPRLRREMADKPAGGSAMGATFLLFALLCTQSSSPRTPLRCSSQAADSARQTLCSLYLVPLGRGTGRIHMIATG